MVPSVANASLLTLRTFGAILPAPVFQSKRASRSPVFQLFLNRVSHDPYNAVMNSLHQDRHALANFLAANPRLLVLTGAGVSLESGIPTYRDRRGDWRYAKPIQEQAFLRDAHTRRRYWARSWYGWPVVRDAQPNSAHIALARLEQQGCIELLITQNVDGLHQRAGSRNVVDLHGRVDRVRCLGCAAVHGRDDVQRLLARDNAWPPPPQHTARPDGDMDVPDDLLPGLQLPQCSHCAGDLRPDVVFFGGAVPPATVQACHDALERSDALLVVGSSLMVFSGYRFCRHAQALGKPIAIINPGVTRADALAQVRLYSPAGPLLTRLVATHGQSD
jgi:NAD-dependent SIR2 family protein deacetylase